MERAEWLLIINVKCNLLAIARGFTKAISQALFPEVLFPNFYTSTVYATPRDAIVYRDRSEAYILDGSVLRINSVS